MFHSNLVMYFWIWLLRDSILHICLFTILNICHNIQRDIFTSVHMCLFTILQKKVFIRTFLYNVFVRTFLQICSFARTCKNAILQNLFARQLCNCVCSYISADVFIHSILHVCLLVQFCTCVCLHNSANVFVLTFLECAYCSNSSARVDIQ